MNETLCLVLKDLKSKKLTLEEIKKKIRPLSKNNGSPLISLIHLFAKVNKAKRIAIHNILLAISSFLKLLRKKVLITTTTVDEKMWEEFNFFWEGLEYTIENTDVIHKKERHIVTILACLIDLNFAVENESRFDVNSRLAFLNEQKKDMDLDVLLHCKTLILPQYRQIKLYFCVLRSTLQAHPVKQWCSATELLKLCLLGKLLKLSADNGSKKSKLLLLDYQHKLKKQSPLLDVLVSHEEFGFIFTKANSIKSLIKTINVPAVYKLLYSSKGNCTLDDAVSNEGKQLCEKPSEETANDAALKKKAKKLISLERDKDLLPGTRTFLSKKLSSRSRDVHMPDTLINGDTAVECLHAKISYHLSELGGRLDKSPWIKDWIKKTLKSKNKESKAKCFASTFLKDFEQVYQLQKELEKNICNCKNCTSKNMESSVDKASRNVERSLDKDSSNVDRSIYKTSKNVDRAGDKTSKNVDRSVDKAYESVVKPLEFKESDLSKELQLFDEKLDKATSKCSVLKSKPVNLEEPAFSKDWKLFDEKLDKDNHKLLKPKPIKIKAQNFSKELFDLSNNQVNDVGIKLRKPVVGSISEKNSSDETQEYANKKTYKKIDEMLSKSKDNEYVTNIISGKQKPKSGRHGDELKASNKRQKHGDKMNVPSFQEQKLKPVVGPEEVGQLSMPSGSSTNLSLEKMETVSNRAKTKTEKRKKIRWRKLKKMKSINDTLVEEMCLTEKVEKITSSPSDNESDSSKNAKVEDNESDSSKNAKVEDNESDSSKNAKVEDNESDSSKNAKVEDNESDSWNTTKVEVTGSESRKRENLDDIESDTSIWKKAKLYNSDGTPAKVRKPRWKKCISVVAEQPRVIPVREAAEDEMSAKCREKSKDFWNDLMGINSGSTKRRRKRNRRKQRMSNTAGSDDNDVEIVELNSSEVFPPTTKDDIVVENGRVCVPYDEGGKSLDNKKSKNERRRKRAKQKRMKEMSKIEERSKVVTGTEAMAMEKDAKVERDLLLSFYKSSPVNTANFQEISCHGNVDDDGDDAEALKVVYETVAFDMSKNNVTMKKQDNQPLLNMLPNIKKKTVIDKVTHSKDGRNTLHKQPDAGINVFETSSPPTGLEHSDDVNSQLSRDISSGSPNHKEASFLQMSKVESLPLCIPSQDTSSHIHICKEHEVIHCDRWNMETEKCQSLNENVQCRENGIGEPHFELPLPELMDYKCINVQMLNSHAPPRLSGDIKALMDSTETKQMLSKNITKRNKRHRMLPSLSAASIMNEDSISSTSDDAEEAYEAGSSDASDNSIYKKLKLKTQKKSQPEEVLNSSQKKKRRSSTPSEGLSLKSSARSPTAQTPLTPVTLSPRSNSTQSPKSDRNHVESPSIISHRGDTLLSPVISNPQIDSISPLITARDFSKSPSAIALSSVKSVSPVLLSSTSLMTRDSPFKSQLEIDETSSELTSVIASNCIAKSSRNLEKDLNSNESPCNVQSANEEVTLMEEQAVKKWYHPLLDSLPSDQSEENSDEAQSTEGGSNFMAATSVQDSPGTDSLGDTLNANQVADECILSSGLDGCISPTPPVEKHLHSVPSPVLIRRFTFNIKSKIKRNSMKLSSSLGTSLETELCECLENSMSLNDSNCSLNVNEQEGEEVEVLSSSSSETELTQIDNISVTPPSSLTNHFPVDFTSDRMDAEMGQRSQKKYVYKKPSKSVQDIVIPSKRNFVDFPTPQKVASEALLGSELIISPGVSDEENEVGKEINSKVKIIENLPQFDQPYPWIRSKSPEKITQEEQTEDDFDKGAEEISVFDSPLKSTNKSATRKLFSPIKSIRATPQKTRSKRIPQKSPKSPISKSPIAKSPFLSSSKSQVVKSPSHSSSKSPVAKSPSHSSSKSPVAKSPSHSSSKSPVAKSPSHSSSKSPVAKSPSHSSKLTQDRGEVMRTPTRKSRMAKISDSEDRDTVSSTPTRIMTRGCKVTIPQFASATELPSMGSFTPSRRRTSNTPNLTPVRRSRRLSGLPTELSEGIIKKFF